MKVRAAVVRSHGSALRLESLDLSEPRADEVLVKIVACGVARADLDAIDERLAVPLPFVPGTEGAGIVERVGAGVSNLAPGDAVVLGFDYCGHCESCVVGRPRVCTTFAARNLAGRRPDGPMPFIGETGDVNGRFFGQSSFATHAVCRADRAVKLAKGSPLEVLACLGGEFLLGAGAILQAFDLQEGDSLVVTGAGSIGLAATMVAKARGAKLIVVAEADERRRTLASELGADAAVHTDENLVDLVRSLEADGATYAVETIGDVGARLSSIESLRTGGACAFLSSAGDADVASDDRKDDGIRTVRIEDHASPAALVPELAALHARGDLPLERLVDFFPFEHVNDALDALRAGAVPKPVLRFSIGSFGNLDRALVEGARHDAPDRQPSSEPAGVEDPALVKS